MPEDVTQLIKRLQDASISKEEIVTIGKSLSEVALQKNGLPRLFMAFNDLGIISIAELL